jgi:hypothetical protein
MWHIYTNIEMSLPTLMVNDLLQPNVKALKTNLLSSLLSHEDVASYLSSRLDLHDLYSVKILYKFCIRQFP